MRGWTRRQALAGGLALLAAGRQVLAAPAPASPATAFVNVNVLPMDRQRVLRGQTVIVADGLIRAIGRGIAVPSGARRIDGGGTAFLLPGLADMHNHSDSRQDLAVQLACGITTSLNMGEARNSFVGRTRAAVARGDVPGPRVFAALAVDGSPQYGHLVVRTPEEARAALIVARANGYDFIKVYNNLSAECFAVLAREGPAMGLPIVGHGVTAVGLAGQIAAGQAMVAHLEEFFYTFFPQPPESAPNAAPDEAAIPAAVALAKQAGTFIVADLVTYGTIASQWGKPEQVQAFLAAPEARYLAPAYRFSWPREGYARKAGSLDDRVRFLRVFARALEQAGVPLLSGTDSPDIPGLVPGFALHGNLDRLVAAGFSRYAALETATRRAGEFIAKTHPGGTPFGTVTPGSRADLILASANPLDDLATLRRPAGVMAGGRWHDAPALAAMLADVAAGYAMPG
ncbi:amidohydrolase family protein [Sphingomonas fennica]|uniref:Amidohydrolase n=1 Tax=Edaphosphingomonas fennica TaxID=114404 RepID=A0A2T4HYH9_9SPHN|nr:amidohydrolase [Sphingomonas fennica]PTD21143.1 amidohydrolase [Sphingomonas fennica]